MGSKSEESPKKDLRTYWDNLTPRKRNLLKLIPVFLIFIALPLTVWVAQQTQNTQQKAAAPDQLEAEGGVLGGNATVIADTSASGGQSVRFSQTNPTQSPSPTPTASSRKIITVSSIAALKTTLADNTVDEIVVTNGTYHVSGASYQRADSLWIGSTYASRTRPILVRAQTTGGVTFDGGGSTYWIGLAFEDGAHHQTWQGFTFANGKPTSTGAIVFGGWAGKTAPHHITLRDITVTKTVTTDNGLGVTRDHALYISQALGGVHDILVDGYTVDGAGGLDSAVNFGHETLPGSPNAWNVTVRNMKVTGTETTIILWESSVKNVLIEDSTITGATRFAVRYEVPGTDIVLRRVVSTGSGVRGLYTPLGANPPGITFIDTNLK